MKIPSKLKNNHLLLSLLGWALFPGMYVLVGILSALGLSVEASFLLASPFGIVGFGCWVIAFYTSCFNLIKRLSLFSSLFGIALSSVPLAFCFYGFWISANGGV